MSLYDASTQTMIKEEGIQKSPVAKGVDCDWHHKVEFGEKVSSSLEGIVAPPHFFRGINFVPSTI